MESFFCRYNKQVNCLLAQAQGLFASSVELLCLVSPVLGATLSQQSFPRKVCVKNFCNNVATLEFIFSSLYLFIYREVYNNRKVGEKKK